MPKAAKYTIRQFNEEFPDDKTCLDYLMNAQWPYGVTCANCQRITRHYYIEGRKGYSCSTPQCGHYVFPTAGTIFHKSATPLRLWFYAIFLMASTRCGISAKQLERELGVTYKTAWRMFHQIRKLLARDGGSGPLSGEVEADETYIGGEEKNKHEWKRQQGAQGRSVKTKTPTFGLAHREGDLMAQVVPNVQARTVLPIIWKNVPAYEGHSIYTDELASYSPLVKLGYDHQCVAHGQGEYVRGNIHTNTLEGFWSLVKRGISGVYHAVSPDYLQAYIDEYSFRYNHRESRVPMFRLILNRAALVQVVARPA